MKFNCDYFRDKLMARRNKKILDDVYRRHALSLWHDYFAWYPIKVRRGDCRWLETIERRKQFTFEYRRVGAYNFWQETNHYRPKQD